MVCPGVLWPADAGENVRYFHLQPAGFSDWQEWAAALALFLEESEQNRVLELPRYGVGVLPKPNTDGLVVFATGLNLPLYSYNGNWHRFDTNAVVIGGAVEQTTASISQSASGSVA